MSHKSLVFGFDVGSGSLGIAVNEDKEILDAKSLLIDADVGRMTDEREKRRAYRTREAHKEREHQLEGLWGKIGETPLLGARFIKDGKRWIKQPGNIKLEREFPQKDEDIVYNSALLRIKLLQGEKLEKWQIYKALRSAIQRRGYDPKVPWGSNIDKKEKAESENKTLKFESDLKELFSDSTHHYPCYYDAYKMGLWSQDDGIINIRLGYSNTEEVRSTYTPPRNMVEQEVRGLLIQASQQIPALAAEINTEDKILNILYGEKNPDLEDSYRRYPSEKHIGGLLGQKIPRFDNRAVGSCSLIPRFKVCRKNDGLFIRVNFLLALKNFRYEKISEDGEITTEYLSPGQISDVYNKAADKWHQKKADCAKQTESSSADERKEYETNERKKCFRMTKPEVKKFVDKQQGVVKERHNEIKQPDSLSGRCRYSRPALALLHELIISGKSPKEFHQSLSKQLQKCEDNSYLGQYSLTLDQYRFRINKEELGFLLNMPDTDKEFYLPQKTLADTYSADTTDIKIKQLIAGCTSPMVRHRLTIFSQQLETLIEKYGEPNHVCIELVREDFMSEEKKKKYEQQANTGRKERQQAVEQLQEIPGQTTSDRKEANKQVEKVRLMREQKYICIYTGQSLCKDKLADYEIDHIIPRSKGGPDALYNKVLTLRKVNSSKRDNDCPFEWKYIRQQWESYTKRVEKIADRKKRALLTATSLDEIKDLLDKYTGLAITSHLARLMRDLICLRMNWQPGEKDAPRYVSTISGGLTNKIAREYRLYTCLAGGLRNIKNRKDKRHHALDAMIISYLPEWARNEEKTEFFKFPEGINCEYFSEKLETVIPEKIVRAKARLGEQPLARVLEYDEKTKKRRYVMKQGEKTAGSYSPDLYINLHKAGDNKGGHWYTSKQKKNEGVRTHGCLIGLSVNDELLIKSLHAFRSPYRVEKYYQRKGYRTKILKRGEIITIPPNFDIKATQLGDDTFIEPGQYRIHKIWPRSYDIIRAADGIIYRVQQNDINKDRIRYEINNIFHKQGGTFSFDESIVSPAGKYRIEICDKGDKEISLIKNGSCKQAVKRKDLYDYFAENIVRINPLKQEDNFSIHSRIKAKSENSPGKHLLAAGKYIIKLFQNKMTRITIETNQGVQYTLQCNELIKPILSAQQPAE